jgi:hypothetical protein
MRLLKIRVHSWGGLGSQLFALASAFQMHQKFPTRKIQLWVHSAGVTKRSLELELSLDWLEILYVNDFRISSYPTGNSSSKDSFDFRILLKKLLILFGFLNPANTDSDFNRIRPWVLSLRGHYSHRVVDAKSLEFLAEILQIDLLDSSCSKSIGIHYRLGDLLTLDSKSAISGKYLIRILMGLTKQNETQNIDVYTDSKAEATNRLRSLEADLNVLSFKTSETIRMLTKYKSFVGTNSKVSIWITLFRLYLDPNLKTYLPESSKEEVSRLIRTPLSHASLFFFDCSSK